MQFSTLLAAFLGLASSTSCLETPSTDSIVARQLGGGPNDAQRGTGWNVEWRDTQLKIPNQFTSARGSGCSYEVTFRRDVRDSKYKLAYFAVFGSGEGQGQGEVRPVNLQYRGTTDAQGRRVYSALVQDACIPRFGGGRPRAFKIYFTESRESQTNWISPTFSA